MKRASRAYLASVAVVGAVACSPGGGGNGDGGRVTVSVRSTPGCFALGGNPFPPGLALLPDATGRAVALTFEPPGIVPIDFDGEAPNQSAGVPILGIPDDSDGDGIVEGTGAVPDTPKLDGVFVRDPELAAAQLGLVTASGYEEVIVFAPGQGALVTVEIEVDASFAPTDYRRLPAPGTAGFRTAISTDACIRPEAPIDSNGDDYAAGFPASVFCDPAVAGSFYARFTSGAAVASGRLFVTVSNLVGGGASSAQYLPGAVLVYDLDLGVEPAWVSPNPTTPAIETFAYNPTDVTRVVAGAREFVLMSASGALGIVQDDPGTAEIEVGTLVLSPAAIEVIDPETLEIVGGTDPDDAALFGEAGFAFDGPALHPSGRVAAIGSAADRRVYLVDLAPLAALASPGDVLADPLPAFALTVPHLAGGPPVVTCTGFTGGVAFSAAGDALYVTERCDGTLTTFDVTLPASGLPVLPSHFLLHDSQPLVASLAPETFGEVRDPGVIAVRSGEPGVDFSGPDVFFLASQPDGQVCALRIESL